MARHFLLQMWNSRKKTLKQLQLYYSYFVTRSVQIVHRTFATARHFLNFILQICGKAISTLFLVVYLFKAPVVTNGLRIELTTLLTCVKVRLNKAFQTLNKSWPLYKWLDGDNSVKNHTSETMVIAYNNML